MSPQLAVSIVSHKPLSGQAIQRPTIGVVELLSGCSVGVRTRCFRQHTIGRYTPVVRGIRFAREESAMSRLIMVITILLVSTVSGWFTALQMRRRAKKALGRKIKDAELTSISTWMKVEEAEKGRPFGE